jgi:HlyD family secretion protein
MKHSKLLIAIISLVIVPLGLYLIFKKQNDTKIKWYSISSPIQKDLRQYITASGRLQAQDNITIGSLVAGRIIKLHVDDNDFVKKDQVLVELDDGIGYSAVKKAKAILDEARANLTYLTAFYARQTALFQAGQLAQDTFESYTKNYEIAKARVTQSEGDLEIRQQEYDNLFIKTPEDGIVISKKVDLGQMVTARLQATELFIIAKDLKKMEALVDVDESDIGLVKIGQKAIFTVDAFPQKPFESEVKQINYDYQVIDNVITYGVILNIDNPNLTLRPGMTTNVSIKVADVNNAICVPNKALRVNKNTINKIAKKEGLQAEPYPASVETKAQETLWIMINDTFKEVPVTLGVTDGRYTQVIDGITKNTQVVIEALDPNRENPILTMGKVKV